ncbi:CHASE3 domain-containing protein [Granulosicoccaceae sp. 1_MG-2023]|nr:CHASE3 domain-containing protein [Granulosicoccaceae sp. 1_MG-2023]
MLREKLSAYSLDQNRKSHLVFSIASVAILLFFVVAFLHAGKAAQVLQETRRVVQFQEKTGQLLVSLLNVETGVRGFMLTGEGEFPEPYSAAIAALQNDLDAVKSLIPEDDADGRQLTAQLQEFTRYAGSVSERMSADAGAGQTPPVAVLQEAKADYDRARGLIGKLRRSIAGDLQVLNARSLSYQSRVRWSIFGICLLSYLLLLWLFAAQQREVRLRDQIALMQARKQERLEAEVEKRTRELTGLAAQLTNVSENEKQRLARELHDDLGASLTAAKMDASWIMGKYGRAGQSDDPKLPQKLTRLLKSLDHAITLKRRLTSDLLPPLLAELGLYEALDNLAGDLGRDEAVKLYIEIEPDLPVLSHAAALALFRIAQEAFTNIRKYASATEVNLIVLRDKDSLMMEITDNGCGFAMDEVSSESFGLKSMSHRARMIGATLQLHSSKGKGTRVTLNLPLGKG